MQTAAFVGAQDEYLSTHAHALVNSHTQPNGVKEDSREGLEGGGSGPGVADACTHEPDFEEEGERKGC